MRLERWLSSDEYYLLLQSTQVGSQHLHGSSQWVTLIPENLNPLLPSTDTAQRCMLTCQQNTRNKNKSLDIRKIKKSEKWKNLKHQRDPVERCVWQVSGCQEKSAVWLRTIEQPEEGRAQASLPPRTLSQVFGVRAAALLEGWSDFIMYMWKSKNQ